MENNLLNAKRKKFGFYEAALATILFIVFNNVFSFFWLMVPVEFREQGTALYYIGQFLVEALFAVVAYVVAVTRKVDFVKGIGADKKINGNLVLYGVLISIVCLIFFGNLTDVFMNFLTLCGYSSDLSNIEINSFGSYLLYVIVLCFAPAVGEEFLFRGAIASGLKEKGFKVALIGSAVIFTFMHGYPDQTVHQFIIGLVIGLIFLKTGNIWIGVVIHFVNNFTAVTMTYLVSLFSDGLVASETTAVATTDYGWLNLFGDLIFALVMAMVGYFIIKKILEKVIATNQVLNNESVVDEENEIIKVDGVEVSTQMTIDGEVKVEETAEKTSDAVNVKKEKELVPMSITIMFVIAGMYFAFVWGANLLAGFGVI